MLPQTWTIETLGKLTENFDSMRIPVKEADRQIGPYPYYGASGIVDYVDKYIFDGEYLLIAEDGENLRSLKTPVAFLAKGKFWVNNHAHIVQGNGKTDTRFLLYALLNTNIGSYLTGSTMPKLTQGNLNRVPIATPPVEEQRAIAHILGTLDDKIELNRRMNETLEAMARALFKSWFVDFDPVRTKAAGRQPYGMDAETAALFPDSFEDSPLGELPRGWRVGSILDIADFLSGGTPKTSQPDYWDGGIPWVSAKDVSNASGLFLLTTEKTISQLGLENSNTKFLPATTTVVTARGTVGAYCLLGREMTMNQTNYGLKAKRGIGDYFVFFSLVGLVSELQQNAYGTIFDTITTKTFRDALIIQPTNAFTEKFEQDVNPLMQVILRNQEQSRTLAALRDALLPKLLSGEVRVRDAEAFIGHAL